MVRSFVPRYVFTHGENLDQNYQINDAPSTYVWQTTTGTTPPTGTFASVATRPYDNKTWGGIALSTKFGFSNDSALQFNYQRPITARIRLSDLLCLLERLPRRRKHLPRQPPLSGRDLCSWRDSQAWMSGPHARAQPRIQSLAKLSPGYRNSADIAARSTDSWTCRSAKAGASSEEQQPGECLGGRLSDRPSSAPWFRRRSRSAPRTGEPQPDQLYKNSLPVTDCRCGVCRPGNMWFNGYLAPKVINTPTAYRDFPTATSHTWRRSTTLREQPTSATTT